MKNYLFEIMSGEYEGERFFIYANSREECDETLALYFPDEEVELQGIYSNEEADILGYDTY